MRDDRRWLLDEMPKGSVCAEIGVFRGDFAAQILEVVKPVKLHLIDPWIYVAKRNCWYGGQCGVGQGRMDAIRDSVAARFQPQIATGQVVVHQSGATGVTLPDAYFDWVYIDGDHQYPGVKRDLDFCKTKVKAGGIIAGDDYNWRGVKKAVAEFVALGNAKMLRVKERQFVLRRTE